VGIDHDTPAFAVGVHCAVVAVHRPQDVSRHPRAPDHRGCGWQQQRAPIGIPPDARCIAKGVATVLDGGSSGAPPFPRFEQSVIATAEINLVNPTLAAATIARHRDRILGAQVRLTQLRAVARLKAGSAGGA